MEFCFGKPSVLLSPYVKQYWGLENCLVPGEEHVQRIVPNGLMDLTFYLGDKPGLLNHHQESLENTVLAGHCNGPYDLKVIGNMRLFSVSFRPLGASMFFNLPMSELYECIVPLRYLIKNQTEQLESALFEANCFHEQVQLVERFLTSLLEKKDNDFGQRRLQESMSLINCSKGLVEVEKLAAAACWSRKQFERNFQELVGTSPKQFMRVVRFQNTLYFRGKNNQLSLTELAYECGFFDQSHMIADFRDLSGKTPRQYFGECEPVSDYFD